MWHFSYFLDPLNNLLSNLSRYQLTYLVAHEDWVIKQEGENIVRHLNDRRFLKSRTSLTPYFLAPQIIHFGSENIYFSKIGSGFPYARQKLILTWFHVLPDKKRLELIKKIQGNFQFIHTASSYTKNQLIQAGVDDRKIVVIPLGVDTNLFKPLDNNIDKENLRQELGLPKDRIIIGSFQKDGVGWNKGEEPKLIKGPDVFVKAVEKLKKYNPLVLLTGPARGYVKKKLAEKNIEFKHTHVSNKEMNKFYSVLDLYIISSRIEGGPKAIVEALAAGVPLVTTKVGMAMDLIKNGENGFLVETEDVNGIVNHAELIINNPSLRTKLIQNGPLSMKKCDYSTVVHDYYEKMYRRLL